MQAQQLTFPTDVRANTIGFATTGWNRQSTASSNPAALQYDEGWQISAAVRNRFLINELFDYGLYGSCAIDDLSAVGIQIEHFGFEQFRQQSFAGSYGRKISDRWSIGLRANYRLVVQEQQENASAISADIGLLYQLNDQILLGVEISPINTNFENEISHPIRQKMGMSYRPSKIVSVYMDLHYVDSLNAPWSGGVGFTYDIFDKINIGLGYRSNPNVFNLGFSWQLSEGLVLNVASSFHQVLGSSPMGGFIYQNKN